MLINQKSSQKILPVKKYGAAEVPAKKKQELLYCGLHICEAIVKLRRDDIIRVYCLESLPPSLGNLLKWCAQTKRAYHVVSAEDLERITGSVHHEGIALLARTSPHQSAEDLATLLQKEPAPLMLLDGVQNPHNIGTIMRVMAHFGWKYLLADRRLPALSAASARVSEGGAEHVQCFALENLLLSLQFLKSQGYKILGTSSHAKLSLYQMQLPERLCVVLGHEVHGVSTEVARCFDDYVAIPGSGQIESLNVSVAAALVLGEYFRQTKQ